MRLFRRPKVENVPAERLGALLTQGAALIDVRTREEWDAGHLASARHIPVDEIERRSVEIDPETLTVFVCFSGRRSDAAAHALVPLGFKVANLVGGIKACERAGLPVLRADGSPGKVVHA